MEGPKPGGGMGRAPYTLLGMSIAPRKFFNLTIKSVHFAPVSDAEFNATHLSSIVVIILLKYIVIN